MTPGEITGFVQSLMNDQDGAVYTFPVVLPYLNMALDSLEQKFKLNNIPVTNETSAVITVPASTEAIGFSTTPALPANLVEIQRLWQSDTGQNIWIPVGKTEFVPHDMELPQPLIQLLSWSWMSQEIRFLPANAIIDLKLDYIRSLFVAQTEDDIDVDIPIINSGSYLYFKTAAFCARFIGEDIPRAKDLHDLAKDDLDETLGISVKGKQQIQVRRLPFRMAYKRAGRR